MGKLVRRHFDDRDIKANQIEFEKGDVFHVKNFYKLMYEWFGNEGYSAADGEGECEIRYWERHLPNGNKEHDILLRHAKYPHGSKYIAWLIITQFKTLNIGKADSMFQGKKIKSATGNVIIRQQAYVIVDPENKWQQNSFLKHWERWFRQRWYVQRLKEEEDLLRRDTEDFVRLCKKYLEIKTGEEHYEPFIYEILGPPKK